MTTYQVAESADLADALTKVAALLEQRHDPTATYVTDLRAAATPGNGWPGPAHVPFHARARIAAAARRIAEAGGEHAALLEDLAAGLDASVTAAAVNGVR